MDFNHNVSKTRQQDVSDCTTPIQHTTPLITITFEQFYNENMFISMLYSMPIDLQIHNVDVTGSTNYEN